MELTYDLMNKIHLHDFSELYWKMFPHKSQSTLLVMVEFRRALESVVGAHQIVPLCLCPKSDIIRHSLILIEIHSSVIWQFLSRLSFIWRRHFTCGWRQLHLLLNTLFSGRYSVTSSYGGRTYICYRLLRTVSVGALHATNLCSSRCRARNCWTRRCH